MSDDAQIPHASRRGLRSAALHVLAPAAAAALMTLAACGGGGGGAGVTPPNTSPSPIGSATPVPSGAPTTSPTPISSPGTPKPSPTASASPTAAPSATPVGSGVSVSPTSLSFQAAGPGVAPQSVSAAQANNTTGFTLSTATCAGIVAVTPASGKGPFSFAPLAAGTCSYTVTGIGGYSTPVGITVTTTTLPQQ